VAANQLTMWLLVAVLGSCQVTSMQSNMCSTIKDTPSELEVMPLTLWLLVDVLGGCQVTSHCHANQHVLNNQGHTISGDTHQHTKSAIPSAQVTTHGGTLHLPMILWPLALRSAKDMKRFLALSTCMV